MKITGIICEYNPLHLGHKKQLNILRHQFPDDGIVCLMSGNYVQRGKPAIFDKSVRAEAAVLCGADLVLELPLTASLSSAEGFASQGVSFLGNFCDRLCFGAETSDGHALNQIAQALLSPAFPEALAKELNKGLSFPAARQAALENLGIDAQLLTQPNNILAVEYCKAILAQNSRMTPLPIQRQGRYHDIDADPINPSAAAIRACIENGQSWLDYIPKEAHACFENATAHRLEMGERAILARLRTMCDEEFEALPYGSEGLWRKLMHAAREQCSLEEILAAAKSKRYTRSRLDRMVMCAFLGLSDKDIASYAPYCRVLALNNRGREILKTARSFGNYPNAGERQDHSYQAIEDRADSLYGLFSCLNVDPPNLESKRRIVYVDSQKIAVP